MKINISEWDTWPFVFSLGILPTIIGLVYFRHNKILNDIDDKHWMLIVFGLTLCAIIFTFLCKWKEEELLRDKENKAKIEKKEASLRQIKDIAKFEYKKVKDDLSNNVNKIIDLKKEKRKTIKNKLDELKAEKKALEQKAEAEKKALEQKAEAEKKALEQKAEDYKEKLNAEKNLKTIHLKISAVSDKMDDLDEKLRDEEAEISQISTEPIEADEVQGEELKKENHKEDKPASGQLLIFAALYAIIGGLAITQALTVFSNPDQNQYITYAHNVGGFIDLLKSKPAFLIASFFPIAILFIHCGIVFLSTDATKIISSGNKTAFFFSSLIIFLEGVVLFYAGNAIDNIVNFSFWIFVLAAIDIVWVLINIVKSIDVLFQWLHLDLIMISFLLGILFMFQSVSQITIEVYVYVLIIFVARTVADYKMGWKSVWSKFDVSEKLA